MEDGKLDNLIKRYLDNSATDDEIQALHDWYRSVNNRPVLSPYKSLNEESSAKEKMFAGLRQQIRNDRNSIRRKQLKVYQYAAAAAIIIVSAFYAIKYRRNYVDPGKYYTTTTTKYGEHKTIHLSDGSTVWLSSGSKITYPRKFTQQQREVNFEGEAYFEIAKDKLHPFIVHSGQSSTKVLGTSFNVRSFNKQDYIEVDLIEGKVSFTGKNSEVILLPKEKLVYNKAKGRINKSTFKDVDAILMRREGEFDYNNVSIEEIAEELTRNFNINIKVEGGVRDCAFYGRLKKHESVDKFLHKMGVIVNATVTKSNNGYLIKGGGCK